MTRLCLVLSFAAAVAALVPGMAPLALLLVIAAATTGSYRATVVPAPYWAAQVLGDLAKQSRQMRSAGSAGAAERLDAGVRATIRIASLYGWDAVVADVFALRNPARDTQTAAAR